MTADVESIDYDRISTHILITALGENKCSTKFHKNPDSNIMH